MNRIHWRNQQNGSQQLSVVILGLTVHMGCGTAQRRTALHIGQVDSVDNSVAIEAHIRDAFGICGVLQNLGICIQIRHIGLINIAFSGDIAQSEGFITSAYN